MSPSDSYIREIKLKREKVASFDEYPFSLAAVRSLQTLPLHPSVTFFIGENGSGKSTLLEAIAVAWGFNPEGGTKNFNFNTRASHSKLHECITLVKNVKRPKDGFFLRAESFFNVATEVDNLGVAQWYGGKSLHEQSHGESFWSLITNRFGGHGLYVLDEPEAALSPTRQLAMLSEIHRLVETRSQFIIATHSPILMAYPNAWIYQISTKGVERIEYKETEHYVVAKRFLNDTDQQLKNILS